MFEPIHGSAFDITGMGIGKLFQSCSPFSMWIVTEKSVSPANPVATFWTIAEMMQWLGESEASTILLDIVETVCEKGINTRDLGGTASTKEVTAAVCREIETRFMENTTK